MAVREPTFITPDAPTAMPFGETNMACPPISPFFKIPFKTPLIIILLSTRFTNLSTEISPFLSAKIRLATSPFPSSKLP